MRSTHFLKPILFLFSSLWMAKAFSVSVGTASECAPFTVSWTGGQSPFQIAIFPADDPPSFYTATSSPYTISQLLLPQGTQFVVTMSDATGFATGGTTDLITVAGPSSGSSCNTTFPTLSYYFSDTSLPFQQCGPFEFNGYQGAILPVTFLAIIPGGESSILASGVTTTTYTWTADVQAGTSIIFSMLDAENNTGGCSLVQIVGGSNDASCLSSNSPSSTASIPQASQSGSSSPSQTSSGSSTTLSVAAIAGIAVGGVVALAALAILLLCFMRRRRRNDVTYSTPMPSNSPPLHSEVTPYPSSFLRSDQTISGMTHLAPQDTSNLPRASTSYNDTSVSSAPPSPPGKGSTIVMTPSGSTRYIVHTDIEDASHTASQVIELPPQYSERSGLTWQ
ncbi:hypothetical protein F5J12DRAFT_895097 [Pisolithus orientalis]|uniref:uncharacterized protein n=1 Tax=Pisolithus orientalis TaxID=936130 RepID=UPI002224565D|nr:uncharacterized protein F5J12DRAFT_895097 [Pisolithus orientalis]KAI5999854.1 hypothetical protein F5J12DRAFT_895097 [Pisolithus orientalis]